MLVEHAIQNRIRLWCGQNGYLAFRCNVGKVKMQDGKWFDTGLPSGFSDLLVLGKNGDVYFIEVKAPGGRQRQDQKDFQKIIEERGFVYILAYSAEDVAKILMV